MPLVKRISVASVRHGLPDPRTSGHGPSMPTSRKRLSVPEIRLEVAVDSRILPHILKSQSLGILSMQGHYIGDLCEIVASSLRSFFLINDSATPCFLLAGGAWYAGSIRHLPYRSYRRNLLFHSAGSSGLLPVVKRWPLRSHGGLSADFQAGSTCNHSKWHKIYYI